MNNTTNILLADDDDDDCLLFSDALAELPLSTSLTVLHDGDELLNHLLQVSTNLPHALFLDLNMPRKKGFDCLVEIKQNALLKSLPVIIYSTSFYPATAELLYEQGAHYYICKPSDFEEVKKVIHHAIQLIRENASQPSKDHFQITLATLSDAQ